MYNIFVYGTLMRGERANSYLSAAKYVGEFRLKDYALYNLGWFPGIRPMSGSCVYGEVYEVSQKMLREMDRYEGEGYLYHRTEVVVDNGSEEVNALAYVNAKEIFGDVIEGGNWKTRKT